MSTCKQTLQDHDNMSANNNKMNKNTNTKIWVRVNKME